MQDYKQISKQENNQGSNQRVYLKKWLFLQYDNYRNHKNR